MYGGCRGKSKAWALKGWTGGYTKSNFRGTGTVRLSLEIFTLEENAMQTVVRSVNKIFTFTDNLVHVIK